MHFITHFLPSNSYNKFSIYNPRNIWCKTKIRTCVQIHIYGHKNSFQKKVWKKFSFFKQMKSNGNGELKKKCRRKKGFKKSVSMYKRNWNFSPYASDNKGIKSQFQWLHDSNTKKEVWRDLKRRLFYCWDEVFFMFFFYWYFLSFLIVGLFTHNIFYFHKLVYDLKLIYEFLHRHYDWVSLFN